MTIGNDDAMKWQEVDIEYDDDETDELDDDQQIEDSDDDIDTGDEKDDEEDQKAQEEETGENEEPDTSEKTGVEDKKKERRRKSRATKRIHQLNQKLREQSEKYEKDLAEIRNSLSAKDQTAEIQGEINSLQTKVQSATQKLAKAKEDNDATAEAQAQAELTQSTFALQLANLRKNTPAPQQNTDDNVKDDVGDPGDVPEAFSDWQEDNEWFSDPDSRDERRLKRYASKIANQLAADGYTAADDDFYEELDIALQDFVTEKGLDVEGFEVETKKPTKKRSKKTPTGASDQTPFIKRSKKDGKVTIRLTKGERETAERLGIDPKDYAKQKVKLNTTKNIGNYVNIFDD
jgi:DNA repair exonuclease SbcCD ATPase subunit